MAQRNVFLQHDAVECDIFLGLDFDIGSDDTILGGPIGIPIVIAHHRRGEMFIAGIAGSEFGFCQQVVAQLAVDAFMPLHSGRRVNGMDQTLAVHREVEQKGSVMTHATIIQVGQFVNVLDFVILAGMIEPPWTDRRVTLAGTPTIAIGMSRLQLLVSRVTGIHFFHAKERPVRRVGIALLVAYPAATGTAVRKDNGIRLQAVDDTPSLGVVVIGAAIDLALLASPSVPAVTAVGAVKPHFKHVPIPGHQFL